MRKRITRSLELLLLSLIFGAAAVATTGCEDEGAFEETGEEVDDALDDVGDEID